MNDFKCVNINLTPNNIVEYSKYNPIFNSNSIMGLPIDRTIAVNPEPTKALIWNGEQFVWGSTGGGGGSTGPTGPTGPTGESITGPTGPAGGGGGGSYTAGTGVVIDTNVIAIGQDVSPTGSVRFDSVAIGLELNDTPNSSAVLQLKSPSYGKGFILPGALIANIGSSVPGMLIYDVNNNIPRIYTYQWLDFMAGVFGRLVMTDVTLSVTGTFTKNTSWTATSNLGLTVNVGSNGEVGIPSGLYEGVYTISVCGSVYVSGAVANNLLEMQFNTSPVSQPSETFSIQVKDSYVPFNFNWVKTLSANWSTFIEFKGDTADFIFKNLVFTVAKTGVYANV